MLALDGLRRGLLTLALACASWQRRRLLPGSGGAPLTTLCRISSSLSSFSGGTARHQDLVSGQGSGLCSFIARLTSNLRAISLEGLRATRQHAQHKNKSRNEHLSLNVAKAIMC